MNGKKRIQKRGRPKGPSNRFDEHDRATLTKVAKLLLLGAKRNLTHALREVGFDPGHREESTLKRLRRRWSREETIFFSIAHRELPLSNRPQAVSIAASLTEPGSYMRELMTVKLPISSVERAARGLLMDSRVERAARGLLGSGGLERLAMGLSPNSSSIQKWAEGRPPGLEALFEAIRATDRLARAINPPAPALAPVVQYPPTVSRNIVGK